MPRKQQTQAEKAQTPLQEELAGEPGTVQALNTTVNAIVLYHKLSHREAICALRDYQKSAVKPLPLSMGI
jgi:hypothetical protein